MALYGLLMDLIRYYEEEPVLWDPNNPEYEHEIKSDEAWERISARMGPYHKVENLKRKMSSLKRMYHTNKLGNISPNKYDPICFRKLDPFLGKTSPYVTTASSTQVEKIRDTEGVKVALGQELRDITKDLATKDDVKELPQQVVNLQVENNTLREEVERIKGTEDAKVALDQKLRDITKDLATKDDVKEFKDDVKELTQQVVNLQLENNTLREEVEKIGDIEGVKVALGQELRDITKDLATKDDVKELTQQVVNLQVENNTLREEVERIKGTEDAKVALDQKLRDITKDLATKDDVKEFKDDVKELTQQVVNLQLENNTLREEVQKIGDTEDIKVALDQKLRDIPKDLATKDDVKELTQQVVNLQLENNILREEVQKIGDTEDVKVKEAGVPQQEDVCGLYAKLLAEKLRRLPEQERLNLMHNLDGMVLRHLYK